MGITLAWPAKNASPAYTVILPNPELGDSRIIALNTIYKYAMDGTMYSYLRGEILYRYVWQFIDIKWDVMEDLKELIENMFQSEITAKLDNGDNWIGFITNFPFEISINNRGCGGVRESFSSFEIEFEGYKSDYAFL